MQREIGEAVSANVPVPLLVYPEGAVNPVLPVVLKTASPLVPVDCARANVPRYDYGGAGAGEVGRWLRVGAFVYL